MKETSGQAKQGAWGTRMICPSLQDASGGALYDNLPGCHPDPSFSLVMPPAAPHRSSKKLGPASILICFAAVEARHAL